MGALASLLIAGAAFGSGLATGVALAATGALTCRAVVRCRRRRKEPEEADPAKRRA